MSLYITLEFLENLQNNNNKEWFEGNRKQYESARDAFEHLIANVITQFHTVNDVDGLAPKDAIFRINRDVRFSKDKSPYNTNMSALIGPDGRKSMGRSYYIRIAPRNESVVASGAIGLTGPELQKIREAIVADAQPLRAIINADTFKQTFGSLRGDQLKTAPKGFPKDHPNVDLLRFNQFMAEHHFSDEEVVNEHFVESIIAVCQAAKPLTMYFDQLLGVRVKLERGRH